MLNHPGDPHHHLLKPSFSGNPLRKPASKLIQFEPRLEIQTMSYLVWCYYFTTAIQHAPKSLSQGIKDFQRAPAINRRSPKAFLQRPRPEQDMDDEIDEILTGYTLVLSLLLRIEREDEMMQSVFGEDWKRWSEMVKWRLIPGVY
ncbi:hypothetical protein D9758_016512 [Tetrapyrgos nigripes]|uniref:Uncharacterized protein n=1 Tax=Tetrapyrgos nigripes TaxID=182062 RepID=A0A8H5CLY5_9AGAR|nr:hypothetical protein D9758_016512 [Tetrapyrgos nigripes]